MIYRAHHRPPHNIAIHYFPSHTPISRLWISQDGNDISYPYDFQQMPTQQSYRHDIRTGMIYRAHHRPPHKIAIHYFPSRTPILRLWISQDGNDISYPYDFQQMPIQQSYRHDIRTGMIYRAHHRPPPRHRHLPILSAHADLMAMNPTGRERYIVPLRFPTNADSTTVRA